MLPSGEQLIWIRGRKVPGIHVTSNSSPPWALVISWWPLFFPVMQLRIHPSSTLQAATSLLIFWRILQRWNLSGLPELNDLSSNSKAPRDHPEKVHSFRSNLDEQAYTLVKGMVFPVVMYGCESWTMKKAECWRIDAFELWCWRRLLRVSWTARRSKQSWVFIARTDVEAETAIVWPPDVKNRLIGKDPDARKDWRWEEKGTTEDEMVGWYHQLDGHEFE